jgi:hypothetical protein
MSSVLFCTTVNNKPLLLNQYFSSHNSEVAVYKPLTMSSHAVNGCTVTTISGEIFKFTVGTNSGFTEYALLDRKCLLDLMYFSF